MKVTATQYNVATAINKASSAEQTRTVAQEEMSVARTAAIELVDQRLGTRERGRHRHGSLPAVGLES